MGHRLDETEHLNSERRRSRDRDGSISVHVTFYSCFKDLTGTARTADASPEGSTIAELYQRLATRFPKPKAMQKSTLITVGVEYQGRDYVLREGDEVSLFPPVQGG